jgi:hypothetical protein
VEFEGWCNAGACVQISCFNLNFEVWKQYNSVAIVFNFVGCGFRDASGNIVKPNKLFV